MKNQFIIFCLFLTFQVYSQNKFDLKVSAGIAQMGLNSVTASKLGIYKSSAISPLIGLNLEFNKKLISYGINSNYFKASFDKTSSPVNQNVNINFDTFTFNPFISINASKKSAFLVGIFSSINLENNRKRIVFEQFKLRVVDTYSVLKRRVLQNKPIGFSLGYQLKVNEKLYFKIERFQSLFLPKESSFIVTPFGKSFFSSWQLSSSFTLIKK